MRVDKIIKLLQNTYEPTDELMIDWVDKFQAEVDNEKQWNLAVSMMEGSGEDMLDMYYVSDMVSQAIDALEEEESEEVSDCCGADIIENTDLCSDCKEHCGIQEGY